MREIFGDGADETRIYQLTKLFEEYLAQKRSAPITPRSINALLNRIAFLELQWRGDIHPATIALYAINKDDVEKDLIGFVSQRRAAIGRFDKDWARGIAALHYGVPQAHALQVLIGPELEQSIAAYDVEAFRRLRGIPGFLSILQTTVETATAADPTGKFVTNVAGLLAAAEGEQSPRVTEIMRTLRAAMSGLSSSGELRSELAAGLIALIESAEPGERQAMLDDVIAYVERHEPEDEPGREAVVWAGIAGRLLLYAVRSGLAIERIDAPESAEYYLEALRSSSSEISSMIHPSEGTRLEDIVAHFSKWAAGLRFGSDTEDCFEKLLSTGINWPWEELSVTTGKFLREGAIDDAGTSTALRILAKLRHDPSARASQERKRLSTDGSLFDKLHAAHTSKAIVAEAAIVSTLIAVNPKLEVTATPGNAAAGQQLASTLSTTLATREEFAVELGESFLSFGHLRDLVDALVANPSLKPVACEIACRRLAARQLGSLHLSDIVARLDFYLALFRTDEEAVAFMTTLPRYNQFWDMMRTASPGPSLYAILSALLQEANSTAAATEILISHARRLDSEEWRGLLETGDEPLPSLRVVLGSNGPAIDFGEPLAQALLREIDRLVSSDAGIPESFGFDLARGLTANGRLTLFKNVRDRLLQTDINSTVLALVSAGGHELVTGGEFEQKSDEVVRTIVIPALAVPEFRRWLAKDTSLDGCVASADSTTRGYLRERIGALGAEDDEEREQVAKLTQRWGIRRHPARAVGRSSEKGSSRPKRARSDRSPSSGET